MSGMSLGALLDQNLKFCGSVEKFQKFHIQQWITVTYLVLQGQSKFFFLNYNEDEFFYLFVYMFSYSLHGYVS